MADEVRRRLHGTRTTFLRVADVPAASGGATSWPAGGRRGSNRRHTAQSKGGGRARARGLGAGEGHSGLGLFTVRARAARRGRGGDASSLLEELQAAGLELVADAAFDQLQDPRRSIEEVNISGLALARLTIHQLASSDMPALVQARRGAAAPGRRDSRVRAAAARVQPRRADDRLRRSEAGGAGAADRRQHRLRSRWTGRCTVRSWRRSRSPSAPTTSMRCRRKTRRAKGGAGPRSRRSVATSAPPARSRSSETDASRSLDGPATSASRASRNSAEQRG